MNDQLNDIKAIAITAGDIAMRHFSMLATLNVEAKGPLDLVTAADRDVERFICNELMRVFPDDGIFGEEGSSIDSRSGRTWVIDPIDGTFNFVRGSHDWGISIGLFEEGEPRFGVVNAPARAEIFTGGAGLPASLNDVALAPLRPFNRNYAAVGVGIHPDVPKRDGLRLIDDLINNYDVAIRVTGSSVISLIDIVKGSVDGYIGRGIPSWDILGMLPCVEQLGIKTTVDWKETGLDRKLDFMCAHPDMLGYLQQLNS